MRCLWITRNHPFAANAGDLIYTARLAQALADAGGSVTMLCRRSGDDTMADAAAPSGIEMRIVDAPMRSKAGAFGTRLPSIAYRFSHGRMRSALRAELRREWDAVLIDSVGAGWALPDVLRHRDQSRRRPLLVYISHNHEASVRAEVARNATGLAAVPMRLDAAKVAPLERWLVAAADLVTTNTAEDESTYRLEHPDTSYLVLVPGYQDRVVTHRDIDGTTPRRAVVLGAFDWIAKRINLEEFVAVADPLFATAGAELVVVGRGPREWLDSMRDRTVATRFTGPVDSVVEYLDDARVGIVAERSGGGFKHKVLYYVFNRVPVAALDGSVANMPLEPDRSIIYAATVEELAGRVLALLDDTEGLRRLQVSAFDRCAGLFDWATRGRNLLARMMMDDAVTEPARGPASGSVDERAR